jgi:hypothetical protein
MLIATVEHPGSQATTRHRVRNLAPGGMRIDNAEGMQPGTIVLASIGALKSVEATIKWVKEGFAGLAFPEPINPEAARKKAAIPPCVDSSSAKVVVLGVPSAPTAGWVEDLRNPYRK